METASKGTITVEVMVKAANTKVWKLWNEPEHIKSWYHASEDWHAPYAENDLREGGRFKITMAAKDGSFSFDFAGVYTRVTELEAIAYTLDDGRKVQLDFKGDEVRTHIVQRFEMEAQHSEEMQRAGWQAILNNFKAYVALN